MVTLRLRSHTQTIDAERLNSLVHFFVVAYTFFLFCFFLGDVVALNGCEKRSLGTVVLYDSKENIDTIAFFLSFFFFIFYSGTIS